MARLTIPDEQTFATFTVVTSTSEFPITFSLFAKADLTVKIDGVALSQSDFAFSGTLLDGGGYDGGTVTLNTAVDDVTVRIERNVTPARTSNFAPASSTPVQSVDQALNRQMAIVQDHSRRVGIVEGIVDGLGPDSVAETAANAAAAEAARDEAVAATAGKADIDFSNVTDPLTARQNIEIENRVSPSLAPAFVFPERGLIYTSPTNLRAGLASTTFTTEQGGGFTTELQIAVTGVKGSATLTSAQTSKVAGLGGGKWAGALNSTDATQDFFVEVIGDNGSTTITLNEPLTANFTGTLCARYDVSGGAGIHLTQGGTRALAQVLADAIGATGSRGRVISGTHHLTPPSADRLWTKNAALTAFGESDSAAPIVQSKLFLESGAENLVMVDVPVRPISAPAGIYVGTRAAGHGADAELYLNGRNCVVEFWTGAWRPSTTLSGVQIAVTVTTGDGAVLYSETVSHVLRRHRVFVAAADMVTVSVANADGGIYNINCLQLAAREEGVGGRLIRQGQKVVVDCDSWGHRYNYLLGRVIAEKTGATVINTSLEGMTSEYFISWHTDHVVENAPDIVIRDTLLNDYSYAAGATPQTFEGPDGNDQDLWPASVVGLTDGLAHWRKNLDRLFSLDAAAGAKTLYFFVGGTASQSATQTIASWFWSLDNASPAPEYVADSAEITDAASFVNLFGKFAGKPISTGGRTLYAQGPEPADTWRNLTDEALATIQASVLSIADYNATTSVSIGTDVVATGGETAADGVSDGVTVNDYGAQTGDTQTASIVSSRQRLASTYAVSSGNRRLNYAFSVTSGRDYMMVAEIVNSTVSQSLDVFSDLGQLGGVSVDTTRGNNVMGAGGSGTVYYRATAWETGSKVLAIGNGRVNSTSRTHDVSRVYCIDLALLFAAAPNQSSLTDAELAAFILTLQP